LDEGLPEKRMTLQPAYKETRKEMPQPMIPQLDYIQNELTALLGFQKHLAAEHRGRRSDGLLRDRGLQEKHRSDSAAFAS